MAIEESEEIAVFQILGIPRKKPADFDMGYFNMHPTYSEDTITQIKAWLSTLSSAEEDEVRQIVETYNDIKYEVTHVKTDKITLNFEEQRGLLREQLLILLPVAIGSPFSSASEGGDLLISAG